ncbi:MAG: hypothetical protein ABI945_01175 [Nitrospirales bacterium]
MGERDDIQSLIRIDHDTPGQAYRATRINIKFWLSKEEQDDLFMAAKLLVKELEDDRLLPGPDSKPTCDRRS